MIAVNQTRVTKQIHLGNVPIGGGAPVVVQSMTNTDTRDWQATVAQIIRLQEVGCEMVRVAVLDQQAVQQLSRIKQAIDIPLIADIHFDHRLALGALAAGVDGLRLNPGNIGGGQSVAKVVKSALERQVPIRIGVNSGSVEKELLSRYGRPSPEAMVESALRHIRMLEDEGFDLIKVSLKSSDVLDTIRAYQLLADRVDYPLHLGVTEAGTLVDGAIKSSLGIGVLLYQGIGDTIRVSLTRPPEDEIPVAYSILRALKLRRRGVELISCPTCGRTELDLIPLVEKAERLLRKVRSPLKVAIMGCVVNGPGEAREADVGIAGGRGKGILFKKGVRTQTVAEEELLQRLLMEVQEITGEVIID
ncbi:flavodoxin-dependent (E)-4-hydroxy-3-methylbut-2-enyl-diphosphate synthase [Desulfoferrobacter suflitae]|uniref:flavodoxin-dependent (E)-4-hydroxy-3-methylbut-2-enyl-diphosphate synthase n=1 Tax=Desulfoferrobacter suflitae TaxID=2865782 RepID=UPI0021647C17|nr:flavodoxin-dependent (E)-4-hydroxy-3-methylbut-2-enyl-diphosphate synthase [Desulfoferrobacter suflitae]MCK8600881.1 flavodoxin-dependent (E)-4-hydroxy-3-methylbut-2-enyl-diphosphate synthase [Desulfoferrobacter suflitae]